MQRLEWRAMLVVDLGQAAIGIDREGTCDGDPSKQGYRATIRVAETTEVSGTITADSIKHGLSAKKQTVLLTIFGCAISVGVLASLAPVPVQAQGQPGSVPPPKQIAALQTQ